MIGIRTSGQNPLKTSSSRQLKHPVFYALQIALLHSHLFLHDQLTFADISGTDTGATGRNADVPRARLMVNDSISKRIAELKAAQAQKCEVSRDQLREFLTDVILTPAGTVNEQSRLCQSYKVTPEVRQIRSYRRHMVHAP